MKKRALLIGVVLMLSGCSTAMNHNHGDNTMVGMKPYETYTLNDTSSDTTISYEISLDGRPFTEYGIVHDKPMHLIVVRDDLRHFQHLHPTTDGNGTWRIDFAPAAQGTYWFYADFADANNNIRTLNFTRTYGGEKDDDGIVKDTNVRTKTVDGLTVTLSEESSPDGNVFRYRIVDSSGQPVPLERYLGARGHSVLVAANGDYVHTHDRSMMSARPVVADQPLDFLIPTLKEPFYRIFTQFQVKGRVHTVEFDR
jgi:hypothetical protein